MTRALAHIGALPSLYKSHITFPLYQLLALSGTCNTTIINNSDIWHRRLGHINPRSLNETIVPDTVIGIPKMRAYLGKICDSCQLGKQVRMPHKVIPHMATTRILEPLHMDLMGLMQIESLR